MLLEDKLNWSTSSSEIRYLIVNLNIIYEIFLHFLAFTIDLRSSITVLFFFSFFSLRGKRILLICMYRMFGT
jgi:hypothetical protein